MREIIVFVIELLNMIPLIGDKERRGIGKGKPCKAT